MKLNISHLIETESLLAILKKYPVGIEVIQFGIASVLDELDKELESYRKALGSVLELREISVHGPFFDLSPASFDKEIRRVTKERFEESYTAAKRLGAKRIIYHTGFIPITYYIEGWLGNSIDFWKEFMGDKDGSIEVHLENVYEEEFWPIAKVIDEVNHPSFTACLDIGHVNAYSSQSIDQWINGLGTRVGHVHIHNNSGVKDEHRALNIGSLDMEYVLKMIKSTVPNVAGTIEISNEEELLSSLEWLKEHQII